MIPAPVKHLCALYEQDGHEIRIVGGWVRDTLRGIAPKDLDLCTTATPEESIALCKRHGLRCIETGLQHGTVSIAVRPNVVEVSGASLCGPAVPIEVPVYEVTTLRIDKETDGRHAVVEFTTDWQADAARRDFTINAMSMDLNGRVFDYFGGQEDIKSRRICFVGDPEQRIREDYLRILRYFRFRGRIGDHQANSYVEGIIHSTADGLEQISVERIWLETAKILSDSTGCLFRDILFTMYVTGTFEHSGLPEIDLGGIERARLVRSATSNPITVLAALTTAPMPERWKMSRSESDLFSFLQRYRMAPLVLPFYQELATTKGVGLAYAVELASLHGPSPMLDELRAWEVPQFPIRGEDIIATGVAPGPDVGFILRRLEIDWKRSGFQLGKEELLSRL